MGIFDFFQADESTIIANKKIGKIYVADFPKGEGKYVSTVFNEEDLYYDVGLVISPKIEVRLTYIAHDEAITGVQISKLSNGKLVEKINLSTLGFKGVLNLLQIFSSLDLTSVSNRSLILDAGVIKDETKLKKHLTTILSDEKGFKIIAELAESRGLINMGDIGNISKKRKSLDFFKNLLEDANAFAKIKSEWKKQRDEDVWQQFFEDNKWIFGYGLEYVFNAAIKKEQLQQVLKGNDFLSHGKKPDGILKTLGIAQFFNIVEIKTHKKRLMNDKMYRISNVWQVSDELTGAIAQCQQYIRITVGNITELIEIKDDNGNRTGEEVFCFEPKCFLLMGSMRDEFTDENGEIGNTDKLSCFEYFRKNLFRPEIITFDQIYQRAKNIINQNS
ncbi:DUF4263 domain-containing protein [Candidatus Microgenomates bacterium]|nr:DUF4263 domain-containing protein [Candidatus Microgenomates bacterium]